MRRSGNKILIIVLVAIAVLAILGGVFAYMFFCTDIFRTSQELFAKYLTQNIDELGQTVDLGKLDEIEEKLSQSKYEDKITISYTDAEETEPSGTAILDMQNDPINEKIYAMLSLATQDPEETLQLEYMKENDMYSVRFTNAVKQFISVENSNLQDFARKLGADEDYISQIPDKIDFEQFQLEELKFSEEEKNTEINKYINIIYNNIPAEKYAKSKNKVITVNGKTITTNAYTLTLTNKDIKNIVVKLLEALQQDEIIISKLQAILPKLQELDETFQEFDAETLKESYIEAIQELITQLNEEEVKEEKNIIITVYEQKGKTVRIKIEQELEYITLDTTEVDGKKQIDMSYTSMDEENTQSTIGIRFFKENANKLIVELNNIEGEEQQSIKLNIELIENGNNINLNITIDDEDGQTAFIRDINFVEEIDYKVTLDNSNNVVLNQLSQEQISSIFTSVGESLNSEYVEQFEEEHLAPFKIIVEPITTAILLNHVSDAMSNTLDENEKAQFNGKFQVYEGTITGAQLEKLLNEVIESNQLETDLLTGHIVAVAGDTTVISKNTYYNVECEMDDEGWINTIIITEKSSGITVDEMSYTQTESVSITKTLSATDIQPDIIEREDVIVDTGRRTISLLRTIGTIVVVMMLLF